MNLSKAKKIVAQAIKNNETQLNLVSVADSEKLSNKDIIELLPDILKLKNLQWLDISYNNLTEFNKEFVKLENLKFLYLRANDLTKFDKEFAKLRHLHRIDLTDNKLTKFDKEFAQLRNLEELSLGENELTSFDREFAKLENLQKLTLYGNPLPFPIEILKQSNQPRKILNFIVEYYEAQERGKLRPLNEAKLVVVGEANVGKTCVINRLIHGKFSKTDSTVGIMSQDHDLVSYTTIGVYSDYSMPFDYVSACENALEVFDSAVSWEDLKELYEEQFSQEDDEDQNEDDDETD